MDGAGHSRRKRTKQGVYVDDIRKEDLAALFHMPAQQAAVATGVSFTVFKRICRDFGIQRWPFRRLKAMGLAGPSGGGAPAPPAAPSLLAPALAGGFAGGHAGGFAAHPGSVSLPGTPNAALAAAQGGTLGGEAAAALTAAFAAFPAAVAANGAAGSPSFSPTDSSWEAAGAKAAQAGKCSSAQQQQQWQQQQPPQLWPAAGSDASGGSGARLAAPTPSLTLPLPAPQSLPGTAEQAEAAQRMLQALASASLRPQLAPHPFLALPATAQQEPPPQRGGGEPAGAAPPQPIRPVPTRVLSDSVARLVGAPHGLSSIPPALAAARLEMLRRSICGGGSTSSVAAHAAELASCRTAPPPATGDEGELSCWQMPQLMWPLNK